jgi:hypothetical protein
VIRFFSSTKSSRINCSAVHAPCKLGDPGSILVQTSTQDLKDLSLKIRALNRRYLGSPYRVGNSLLGNPLIKERETQQTGNKINESVSDLGYTFTLYRVALRRGAKKHQSDT